MDIKIKMHSVLDAELQPDIKLINDALGKLALIEEIDHGQIERLRRINDYLQEVKVKETHFMESIKDKDLNEEAAAFVMLQKNSFSDQRKKLLTWAVEGVKKLDENRGCYGYEYDKHYNSLIAGLMGSACYMKGNFEQLASRPIETIERIAGTVSNNGHHSTFGHSHLTLEISGIPKAFAMILNNEKEYCTSEKSARYTVMDEIAPEEKELFDKWKAIFAKKIGEKYGDKRPFFDEKGTKVDKLAQENARYLLSVFTHTNMEYTTSYRQLNYICHWLEEEMAKEEHNDFIAPLLPFMKEFVEWTKENNLYDEVVKDGKDRKLSLFGDPIFKQRVNSDTYALCYNTSLACLAQLQRHRTIAYHVDEDKFNSNNRVVYIPPIIRKDEELVDMWIEDYKSVAHRLPQGTIVPVVERGLTENFLLKSKERVCALAQKEVRDLTKDYCKVFALALDKELAGEENNAKVERVIAMQKQFERLSKGARCTNGYACHDKCGFSDGVNLESLI